MPEITEAGGGGGGPVFLLEEHLLPDARALWDRINPPSIDAGMLREADALLTCELLNAFVQLSKARDACNKHPLLKDARGNIMRNPLWMVVNRQAAEVRAHCAELGLSPVARARLMGIGAPPATSSLRDLVRKP